MVVTKIIALTLIPAGAAALGTVSYLQHHPRALTSDTHVVAEAPRALPLVAPSPAVEPLVEEEANPVVLEPLVVAKPPPAKARVQKLIKKVPCSGWRDLGYRHVDNGKASGVTRVRELCDPE